jgi:hypothetical protein
MDKPESSCAILSKLNLYDVEKVVKGTYHEDGPGRSPRKRARALLNSDFNRFYSA